MSHIPDFYQALLNSPGICTLSAVAVDGSIRSIVVWRDFDGEFIRISLSDDSPQYKSIRRTEQATVVVTHPSNEGYYISLRCSFAGASKEGAIEFLDQLTMRNMNKARWFGDVVQDDPDERAKSLTVLLRPERIYYTE